MIFLVYSSVSSATIADALGAADYSYYFVMQRFLPLLEKFGEVAILEQPPTDEVVEQYLTRDRCLFLSFTPPDKVAPVTRCPVVPVFAWEYSSIPCETFTRPEDDWVADLRRAGFAITHSGYAAEVVRGQVGEDCKVVSIPAPLWDSCERVRKLRAQTPPQGLDGLDLNCTVIDSACYDISNTGVRPRVDGVANSAQPLVKSWDGQAREYLFSTQELALTLIGFNLSENWGVWSKSGYPWIILDRMFSGQVELEITLRGHSENLGQPLGIELGTGRARVLLTDMLETHRLTLNVEQPTNFLAFTGVEQRPVGMQDPRDLGFGLSRIALRPAEPTGILELDLSRDHLSLEGFHQRESAGRWTAASRCRILLPRLVSGRVELRLELFHMLHNDGRRIELCLGENREKITLRAGVAEYRVRVSNAGETDVLLLDKLGLGPSENPQDQRQLGLGVARITITERASARPRRKTGSSGTLEKDSRNGRSPGILYTAILNPHDGRKNWEDIITAFVYAFRETPHVTLLVKIISRDLSRFFEDIFGFFTELHPFRCRLMFIHGYLDYSRYEQLMAHSHFIVNASRGEGQCLPLMEFMSCGVPAIAPANTAMLDYLDSTNGFVVQSSPEVTFWPHDPRQVFRTLWRRIDWQTLYQAFVDSERLVTGSPRGYRDMSRAAVAAQQKFCSMRVAEDRLRQFLALAEQPG